jgi:hypothetical protein
MPRKKAGVSVEKTKETAKDTPDAKIMRGYEHIRTYTPEVHGPEYLLLAEQFKSKDPNYEIVYG